MTTTFLKAPKVDELTTRRGDRTIGDEVVRMALMKCLDCGNDVSTAAPACPKCGRPTPMREIPMPTQQAVQRGGPLGTASKVVAAIAASLIVIGVMVGVAKTEGDKPYATRHEGNEQPAVVAQVPSAEPVAVGALIAAYDENEVAADNSYKNHRLQITAPIKSIGKDITDDPYVTFGQAFKGVNCYFGSDQAAAISTMKKGRSVTVEGTCRGLTLGSVILKDCSVVSQ